MSECDNPHPWIRFLNARYDVILWMHQKGRDDKQIAYELSMDERQVNLIRNATHFPFPEGKNVR